VFYHGSWRKLIKVDRYENEVRGEKYIETRDKAQRQMGELQTQILAQAWFTAAFVRHLVGSLSSPLVPFLESSDMSLKYIRGTSPEEYFRDMTCCTFTAYKKQY
jgi:hypothetical protein